MMIDFSHYEDGRLRSITVFSKFITAISKDEGAYSTGGTVIHLLGGETLIVADSIDKVKELIEKSNKQ